MMSHQSMESVVDRAADRPLLANDLYLLAHDRPGGSSVLAAQALNLGVAGALLAELVLVERLNVEAGRVWVVAGQPPPDSLTHEVLDELISEPTEQTLRTWLRYLARPGQEGAARRVAQRLARARILERQEDRGWLRTTVRYVPVDAKTGWPAVRLCQQVTSQTNPPLQDRVLVGLVNATELTRRVFAPAYFQHPDAYVRWCVKGLPPPLRELVDEVNRAVGKAATAPI